MFRRKKKLKIHLLAPVFIAIIGGLAAWSVFYGPERSGSDTAFISPSIDPAQIAGLVLDFGDGTKREFEGEVLPPMSALDALYSATLASKIEFDYQPSTEGTIIHNIAGKTSGSSGNTWQLYVNGEKVLGDPALFMINPLDALEWKYE